MWTQRFIETNRGTFEVYVKGQGEPICITHLYCEYNGNGNQFANHFTDYFNVFLVNLRGAGNSEAVVSDEQLKIEESVKDLEAIRMALNFEHWSFAGYSAGGMLGLSYVLQSPVAVKKLFVCGSAASNQYTKHPDSIFSKENPKNLRVKEILTIMNDINTSLEKKIQANREWSMMYLYRPEKLDEYFSKPDSGSSVPKLLNHFAYEEVRRFDITDQLINISVPTIVLAGLHDAGCPIEFCREIASAIPDATLVVFEESNHAPYIEEPEKFAESIRNFVYEK